MLAQHDSSQPPLSCLPLSLKDNIHLLRYNSIQAPDYFNDSFSISSGLVSDVLYQTTAPSAALSQDRRHFPRLLSFLYLATGKFSRTACLSPPPSPILLFSQALHVPSLTSTHSVPHGPCFTPGHPLFFFVFPQRLCELRRISSFNSTTCGFV